MKLRNGIPICDFHEATREHSCPHCKAKLGPYDEAVVHLDEFKAWVVAHDAVCDDPIWCPTIYTARKAV